MKQNYTSADTSINENKLPRGYRFNIPAGALVIDYGCGKHTAHLKEEATRRGWKWSGYDPFNQTDAENAPALELIENGAADYAICCNVLNVIDSNEVVNDVIRRVTAAGKTAVFTVYEGNKTGAGRVTKKDCYQRNERRAAYVERIAGAGYQVTRRGEYIIVTR